MQGSLEQHLGNIVNVITKLAKRIRKLEVIPPGANKFIELSDAPSTYVGSTGLFVAVNAGETALEFVAGGGPGGPHDILSATHSDSNPDAVIQGDVIIGNATPAWDRLPIGGVGEVLTSDGTDPSWQAPVPGGAVNFTDLADVPASYLGHGTELVVVNAAENALEFVAGGGGGPHAILSATHSDAAVDAVSEGSLIVGNATPAWDELVISVPGANIRNVLGVDNAETQPSWKPLLDGTDPTTIAPGDVAAEGVALVASHRDHLHGSPTTFPATAHNILSASHGDALPGAIAQGDILIGNATPKIDKLTIGGNGTVLTSDGTDPSWQASGVVSFGPYKVYLCKSFI